MPRAHEISVYLVGSEKHKARPDLSDDSGFWLRVKAADTAPFVKAFKASPSAFHEFRIEQRVGKETRISRLDAHSLISVGAALTLKILCVQPHGSVRWAEIPGNHRNEGGSP